MQLRDVYLVTTRIKRVPARSLQALQRDFGFPLPTGYCDYLTRLGVGRFAGVLYVYTPEEVEQTVEYWRASLAEAIVEGIASGRYRRSVLSAKKVREAVLFGYSSNGDMFVSTPSSGQTLFAIPQDRPGIRTLRDGFQDPMACCRAVGLHEVQPWFESHTDRRRRYYSSIASGIPDIERALSVHWGNKEIRRFEMIGSTAALVFGVRAIEGLVVLDSKARPGHVFTTIWHDKDFAGKVRSFFRGLGVSMPAK
jgi:hypothetical protein